MTRAAFIHVHSIRIASGEEVLVARVLAEDGRLGYGFSFRLDATEARHMAEYHAGVRAERPPYASQLGHRWERSFLSKEEIEWRAEAAFAKIRWHPEERREHMGKTVSFNRPDGKSVNGYLAEPAAGAKAPAMVVIQEWWGMNDQIRGVADRLAKAGYRALVPDLYRGKVTVEAKEAEHLMKGLNFGDAAGQDIRGAVQYLKKAGGKVGVTGFCMGGALTVLSACNVPEMDAGVIWYGYPPLEYVDAKKIKAPLLGHWATEDQAFAISGVDALEKKLKDAAVKFEFHRYKAKHAFANETADEKKLAIVNYDPKSAELAWQRTMDFLGKTLKS
jgi:carboxymethylenebutenolidase